MCVKCEGTNNTRRLILCAILAVSTDEREPVAHSVGFFCRRVTQRETLSSFQKAFANDVE